MLGILMLPIVSTWNIFLYENTIPQLYFQHICLQLQFIQMKLKINSKVYHVYFTILSFTVLVFM